MKHDIPYLCNFLASHNSDWDKYMLLAEFALNTHVWATGYSPYSLLYTQHAHIPDTIISPLTDNDVPRDVAAYVGRWQINMDAARTALSHCEP
jgi:hypothetical protein